MRPLKRVEIAAMWLYHDEYAAQALGAIEFYRQLSLDQKRLIEQMVDDIVKAQP